ncbi:porin [Paraburkholderia acidisoli]|uniref:Porin n=1 Tax=Paraburkholderia acidisoli TaxID=2571748 RepID=A0A7Z2GN21_9BURK|nr:porin [Paraburkholderia acidisoli]QGZ64812.1 porin [Paraburkholderia acidisoli]
MKRVVGALALGTLACAAHAQSSVTLYGIIDGGVRYTNNGHGAVATTSTNGWLSSSRFGFIGHENLGGGWKANFVLEAGFNESTGAFDNTTGILFNRQSYVGLSGPYGQFTMGRQYNIPHDLMFVLDTFNLQYPSIVPISPALVGIHYNNDVKYKGDFGPVRVSAENSFGGVAGNFNDASARSVGLQYKTAWVILGGFYTHRSVASGTVYLPDDFWAVGAKFTAGGLKLSAGLMNENEGGNAKTAPVRTENWFGGVTYDINAAVRVGGAFYETNLPNTSGRRDLGILSVTYSLSKRTMLFAETDYTRYHGSYITNATLNAQHADHQIAATVGIDHTF